MLIRFMTLLATVTLAAAVLLRSPSDLRMGVCVVVSVTAITLAFRSLFTGKLLWALLFGSVLGLFTPFHQTQYSHFIVSILDMATLALFAASPILLGKSARALLLKPPTGQM